MNLSQPTLPSPAHGDRAVVSESRGLRQMEQLTPPTPPTLKSRAPSSRVRVVRANDLSADVYRSMVTELKARYKISIRRWHTRMSGVAYELKFRDGRIKRLIAAPRPCGPVSAAIFLHEVGHHAVGFHRYSPRCLEEYYAWQWAFREMNARNIPVNARVLRHYRRSMHHYVRSAQRHGQIVPHELHGFIHHTGQAITG